MINQKKRFVWKTYRKVDYITAGYAPINLSNAYVDTIEIGKNSKTIPQ